MSSSQDLHSDHIISPDPSSEPDPNPTQLQLDPSTLSQVLTGAIQLAQSAGSSVSNRNKSTKAKMPRKSKASQAKPSSPRKSKPRQQKSKKSKNSKTNNESSQEDDEKGNKTTVQWEHDHNADGKTSMYLLLNWLTDEDNFSRFKDNKSEKRAVAEEIERYLIENGITWRDANSIRKKIGRLEEAWRKADGECNRTGAGSWKTAQEVKAAKGWGDEDDEWLKLEKVAMAPILKLCKYYFELEPVFGTRHANVRLAATRSLPATSRNDESEDDGQIQRDAREHSINSNLAYEMDQNGSERTQLDEGMNRSLVNDSHLPNEDSDAHSDDITMEEMRRVMNDNFDETPGISDTYTPIRAFQSSQTRSQPQLSSSSLKRTSSKHSLESASQSTMSKRARQSGSASSIQGLFEGRNYGSSSAGADTFTSTIEREAVINHGKNMDRLTQLAVNMNTAMFGQPTSQPVLSEEQIQKKSSIEIELADVKLSSERFDLDSRKEKHLLEIQQMKAEMEHQQVSRNAQLISTLMRDHNMNIHDAMLAAQQAQAMVQSSSSAT